MSDQDIDRVAQAIHDHAASKPAGQPCWDDATEDVRDWLRGHARAAMDAMDQPVTLKLGAFQAASIGFWLTFGAIVSIGVHRVVSGLTKLFWIAVTS